MFLMLCSLRLRTLRAEFPRGARWGEGEKKSIPLPRSGVKQLAPRKKDHSADATAVQDPKPVHAVKLI